MVTPWLIFCRQLLLFIPTVHCLLVCISVTFKLSPVLGETPCFLKIEGGEGCCSSSPHTHSDQPIRENPHVKMLAVQSRSEIYPTSDGQSEVKHGAG